MTATNANGCNGKTALIHDKQDRYLIQTYEQTQNASLLQEIGRRHYYDLLKTAVLFLRNSDISQADRLVERVLSKFYDDPCALDADMSVATALKLILIRIGSEETEFISKGTSESEQLRNVLPSEDLREMKLHIDSAMERLPLNFQSILFLHYREGMSADIVASVLSRDDESVKTDLNFGLCLLCNELRSIGISIELEALKEILLRLYKTRLASFKYNNWATLFIYVLLILLAFWGIYLAYQ